MYFTSFLNMQENEDTTEEAMKQYCTIISYMYNTISGSGGGGVATPSPLFKKKKIKERKEKKKKLQCIHIQNLN